MKFKNCEMIIRQQKRKCKDYKCNFKTWKKETENIENENWKTENGSESTGNKKW